MWKYFNYETDKMLACPCCGKRGMDDDFMKKLDILRQWVDFPLSISSGYRCPKYNAKLSSTGETGPHTTGKAVDIPISGEKALEMVGEAITLGFSGVGVKQKGPHNKRFIHLDTLGPDEGPRPWIWSY